MREIGIDRPVERKRGRGSVKGAVSLGIVPYRLASQPSEKLIDVADSLDRTESLTISCETVRSVRDNDNKKLGRTQCCSIYQDRPSIQTVQTLTA